MTHKSEKISSFEVLGVIFCGMKTSPVAWPKEKKYINIQLYSF
jgi:hypothetical protein